LTLSVTVLEAATLVNLNVNDESQLKT